MDWFAPIDAYCERTSAAFGAEPLNAASNAAFLSAALAALFLWRRHRARTRAAHLATDWASPSLIALVAAIGVGSFLFHTLANRWSALADVLPIAAFVHAYLALALFRFAGLSATSSLLATLAFFAASFAVEPLAAPLVGSSAPYVPALLALLGLGVWLPRRGAHRAARALRFAGWTFLGSLALRTLDEPRCDAFPSGTHFAWHLLNALTLFVLLAAAIRHGARPGRRRIMA